MTCDDQFVSAGCGGRTLNGVAEGRWLTHAVDGSNMLHINLGIHLQVTWGGMRCQESEGEAS